MTDEQVSHLALDLLRTHPNNPRSKKAYAKANPKMVELVASIREHGIWQPMIVRVHPTEASAYQVLAGHRRFHAAKIAKVESVPVIIREHSDEEAIAFLLADNPLHEGIDPIEEAKVLKLLLKQGQTADQIAAFYGRPASWVHRRARLACLSAEALDLIEAEYEAWTPGHMELIARYEETQQKEILEGLPWNAKDATIEQLDQLLRRSHRDLTKAPWSLEDAELVPKAGACAGCTKRSSCHQVLFPDLVDKPKKGTRSKETDTCLDTSCWETKVAAHLERRIADLAGKHPGLIRVSSHSYGTDKSLLYSNSYQRVARKTEGARAAVVVDGNFPGTLIYCLPPKGQPGKTLPKKGVAGSEAVTLSDDQLRVELAGKREALAKRRTIRTFEYVLTALKTLEPEEFDASAYIREDRDDDPIVLEDDEDYDDLDDVAEDDGPQASEAAKDELPDLELAPSLPSLAQLVAWSFLYGTKPGQHWSRWSRHDTDVARLMADIISRDDPPQMRDHLWSVCWQVMRDDVHHAIQLRNDRSPIPRLVAQLIGLDIQAIQDHVATQITEPKSWAKQYAAILEGAAA